MLKKKPKIGSSVLKILIYQLVFYKQSVFYNLEIVISFYCHYYAKIKD